MQRQGEGARSREGPEARARQPAEILTLGSPAASRAPKKDASVETLRGIAIILVVGFHAIDTHLARLTTDSGYAFFSHLSFSLSYVRMPLFTVISGFVYALRPVRRGRLGAFLAGKGRRILLPFVSVATLQYVAQALLPGSNHPLPLSGLWRVYLFGYAHFWFLQAIALIFLTVAILDRYAVLERPSGWLACLAVAATVNLIAPQVAFLSLGGFTYLLPYFLLGYGIERHAAWLLRPRVVASALIVALAGLALQQAAFFGLVDVDTGTRSPLALAVGLPVILVVFRYRRAQPLLARVGVYAYAIYLFHQLALALAPRMVHLLGLEGLLVVFAWKMALGLTLPVMAERIFARSRILRRVLVGLR